MPIVRNDVHMTAAAQLRRPPEDRSGVAGSIETAVKRLVVTGYSRAEALGQIQEALQLVLGILTGVGIGDAARLNAQLRATGAKIAELNRTHESESDTPNVSN